MRNLRANRVFANLVAIRDQPALKRGETERAPGQTVIGVRVGHFGHPTTTILRIQDEKVVGAVEDVKELSEIVTQLGLLSLAALLKYNLAGGPEGLAKEFARWCGIDLEALAHKAADADLEAVKADIEAKKAATESEAPAPGDEMGGEA